MSQCDEIRELLALAAAGALDEQAQDRVAQHISECASCAAEFVRWGYLARGLRRVPTARPAAAVVERARARAQLALIRQAERRRNRGALILVVALAWIFVLASWPVARLFSVYLQLWFATPAPETWHVFGGITAAGWVAGSVAAAVLAWRQNRERRFA
jgi:predicted anti-sigma-YlaC factor YlaD